VIAVDAVTWTYVKVTEDSVLLEYFLQGKQATVRMMFIYLSIHSILQVHDY